MWLCRDWYCCKRCLAFVQTDNRLWVAEEAWRNATPFGPSPSQFLTLNNFSMLWYTRLKLLVYLAITSTSLLRGPAELTYVTFRWDGVSVNLLFLVRVHILCVIWPIGIWLIWSSSISHIIDIFYCFRIYYLEDNENFHLLRGSFVFEMDPCIYYLHHCSLRQ
jgi:hypothetical protein